jgi:pheromone shutdown protein TraB
MLSSFSHKVLLIDTAIAKTLENFFKHIRQRKKMSLSLDKMLQCHCAGEPEQTMQSIPESKILSQENEIQSTTADTICFTLVPDLNRCGPTVTKMS